MPQVYKSAQSVFNLKTAGKTDWYRIENKAGAPAQVHIYDEIGMYGCSAGQFIKDLDATKGDIELHLSTPGGEVWDGIAIYNALKKRNPTVIVDALAASIGSVIAMAAAPGKLFMESTARMMIHDGFCMAAGNAAELSKLVEQLNSASDTIAGIYATRTGKPQADWRAKMQAETWYTADEAVAAGIADGIVGADGVSNRTPVLVNQAQHQDCPSCSAQVADITAKFCGQCGTAVRNADQPKQLGDGWVQDADGTKRFDPDGDGDDDSTAEGDTDHDYWDADGKQVKDIPPCPKSGDGSSDDDEVTNFLVSALRDAASPHAPMKGTHSHPHPAFGSQGTDATHDHDHSHDGDASHSHSHTAASDSPGPSPAASARLRRGDIDFSEWKPSQAWHNAATSADPAAYYAAICAGRRTGDPAVQSSWAFPYRYEPGGPPNAEAVRIALDRLPGTDGLVNTTEATVVLNAARDVADLSRAAGELERAQAALARIHAAQATGGTVVHEHLTERDAVRRGDVPATDPFAALMNAGVDESPWNAAKAWHNGAAAADPAAFYAGICAGEKAGDKATQAAWALPYRYTPTSAPNAAGVKAALGRLSQTDGLTNEAEAKAKLQGLMKKINPDYEPDNLAELFRSFALKEA